MYISEVVLLVNPDFGCNGAIRCSAINSYIISIVFQEKGFCYCALIAGTAVCLNDHWRDCTTSPGYIHVFLRPKGRASRGTLCVGLLCCHRSL